MKVINLNKLNQLDHEDIKENAGSNEAERREQRLKIIRKFISWAPNNKDTWNKNHDEKTALMRQKNFNRCLYFFGAVGNFFIYQAFLTGTYNYRNNELLRMRRVPFVLKISLSTAVTAYMCHSLYIDSLYDEETYRISLKYRHLYDDQYKHYSPKNENQNDVV